MIKDYSNFKLHHTSNSLNAFNLKMNTVTIFLSVETVKRSLHVNTAYH